ncbi:MAG: hypothetical protein KGN00_09995 [Chloroflexota bacterium]|nr:hypothetical protein [Chloroflexota bacterium]
MSADLSEVVPIELPRDIALDWLRKSLMDGSRSSAHVLAVARLDHGHLFALAPAGTKPSQLTPAEGGVASVAASDAALAVVLAGMAGEGASCVVIEDDVQRRGDPSLPRFDLPSAFLDDRVIHWRDLTVDSAKAAVVAVQRGASGYPLNAFVTTRSAASLGLVDGRQLDDGLLAAVESALMAVIVAVFDAESFLVWQHR